MGERPLIRTFVALDLPEPVRQALSACIGQMSSVWPPRGVRWVGPENLHLTLRFLGHTREDLVPALASGLDEIAAGAPPLDVALGPAGCFPNPRRPRIVWVGLVGAEEELARLQRQVERLARQHGWGRQDKPFHAHLTLGRVREGQHPPSGEWLCAPEPLPFRADTVHLMESQLEPLGARYTPLHTVVLRGA
ncbi:MAG: RNA 2',3'-cyclic phosphodiesterase [Candidatus Latescibacterota bacterium]